MKRFVLKSSDNAAFMKSALGNGSRSLENVDLALHPCNNGVPINTEKFVFENTIIQADFLLMFNVWTVDEIVFFYRISA